MRLAEQINTFLGSTGKLERLKLGERPSKYLAALLLQERVAKEQLRDLVFGREYPASWENQLSAMKAEIQTKINTYAQIKNEFGKGWYIDEDKRTALREILAPDHWEDEKYVLHRNAVVNGHSEPEPVEEKEEELQASEEGEECYEIVSNIPIPTRGSDSKVIKTVQRLKPGQSFFVPKSDYKTETSLTSKVSNWKAKRYPDWKFRYAVEKTGVRIWRMK